MRPSENKSITSGRSLVSTVALPSNGSKNSPPPLPSSSVVDCCVVVVMLDVDEPTGSDLFAINATVAIVAMAAVKVTPMRNIEKKFSLKNPMMHF